MGMSDVYSIFIFALCWIGLCCLCMVVLLSLRTAAESREKHQCLNVTTGWEEDSKRTNVWMLFCSVFTAEPD